MSRFSSEPEVVPAMPTSAGLRIRDDELLAKWQAEAFENLEKAKACRDNDQSGNARNYAWIAGVATDKVLTLSGRPTHIVAGLHEVRHSLPEVTARLLAIAARSGVANQLPRETTPMLPAACQP